MMNKLNVFILSAATMVNATVDLGTAAEYDVILSNKAGITTTTTTTGSDIITGGDIIASSPAIATTATGIGITGFNLSAVPSNVYSTTVRLSCNTCKVKSTNYDDPTHAVLMTT
jgi:hypothetical protein